MGPWSRNTRRPMNFFLASGDRTGGWNCCAAPPRLRRMVALRWMRGWRPGRSFRRASRGVPACGPRAARLLAPTEVPFFVWLRRLAGRPLRRVHREHLGAKMRDAGREVSLDRGPPTATRAIAARLWPSSAAEREPCGRVGRRVQDAAQRHGTDGPRSTGPAPLQAAYAGRGGDGAPKSRGGGGLRTCVPWPN